MTEIKVETVPEAAKELLALNPTQESEFKKKVQEVKKNKSKKVSKRWTSKRRVFIWYFPQRHYLHDVVVLLMLFS